MKDAQETVMKSNKKGRAMPETIRRLYRHAKSAYTLLMILVTLGYLLATHLSAMHSLELALTMKADRGELELLDKKLTRIEVKLEEALIAKEAFDELREKINERLLETAVSRPAEAERKHRP
jgi:cytochrome c-type biogenesis protein CcmH/NrfG